MLHGGARPGAGRPKGATGKKTKEIISAVEAAGIMPVDVMLHVMREYFNKGEYDAAVKVAAKVAPYVHRRLAASPVTLRLPSEMTDEELDAFISDAEIAAAAAEELPGSVPRRAGAAKRLQRAWPPITGPVAARSRPPSDACVEPADEVAARQSRKKTCQPGVARACSPA
jgi:hypothetical protein